MWSSSLGWHTRREKYTVAFSNLVNAIHIYIKYIHVKLHSLKLTTQGWKWKLVKTQYMLITNMLVVFEFLIEDVGKLHVETS